MCLGLEEERERGKLKELLSVGNYIAAHGRGGQGDKREGRGRSNLPRGRGTMLRAAALS